jgi:hypothetical protein
VYYYLEAKSTKLIPVCSKEAPHFPIVERHLLSC